MKRPTKPHPIRIILGLAVAIGVPGLLHYARLSQDLPISTDQMLTTIVAAFFSCIFGASIAFGNGSHTPKSNSVAQTDWGDDQARFGARHDIPSPDWNETNQTSSANYYYNHHGRLDQN